MCFVYSSHIFGNSPTACLFHLTRQFKPRLFKLVGQTLFYYISESDVSPLGQMDLKYAIVVSDGASADTFVINIPSRKPVQLQGQHKGEATVWVDRLTMSIRGFK